MSKLTPYEFAGLVTLFVVSVIGMIILNFAAMWLGWAAVNGFLVGVVSCLIVGAWVRGR